MRLLRSVCVCFAAQSGRVNGRVLAKNVNDDPGVVVNGAESGAEWRSKRGPVGWSKWARMSPVLAAGFVVLSWPAGGA